jgi:spermidine/putrescine transport system permease protein
MVPETSPLAVQRRPSGGFWAWVRRHLIIAYTFLALVYLFLPVLVVILFSFNDTKSRTNTNWQGFTLKWWENAFAREGLFDALVTSFEIALISSLVATMLGTLIALALVRYRFWGRSSTNLLLFIPMATPEVVLGSSLLTLFIGVQGILKGIGIQSFKLGFLTIVIAHILFNISYVVVTVKARISGFDRHLEEAAMDLYADEWQTFIKVTLPMIMPGVFAAFLLGFALSFDDFIITNFNSGTVTTFPIYIWGSARLGIPAQVNVFSTALFVLTVVAMFVNIRLQGRRK